MSGPVIVRTDRQIVVVPSPPVGTPGATGTPGANVDAIGLFTALAAMTIPLGTDVVHTSGHTSAGKGAGRYVADASVTVLNVGTYPEVFSVDLGGRGWRLDHQQDMHFHQFGAAGDNSTDDLPAWNAAKNYFSWLLANGRINYYDSFTGLYRPFPHLDIKAGHYYFSATPELDGGRWDVTCEGAIGAQNGSYGVAFRIAPGNDGMVAQNYNTTGVNGSKTTRTDSYGGQGSVVRGLLLYTTGAGSYSGACGFYSRTKILLIDCAALNFPADGCIIAATAGAGGSLEGNANGAAVVRGFFQRNGSAGVRCVGADANVVNLDSVTSDDNGQFAVSDQAFLQISPRNVMTETNGVTGAGPTYALNARGNTCSDGTYRYYIKDGQATAASTTSPTAGTSNAVWGLLGAGASDGYYFPTWTSGLAWRDCSVFRSTQATSQTVWRDCYGEGNNAPAQLGVSRWDGGEAGCPVFGLLIQNGNSGIVEYFNGAIQVISPNGAKTRAQLGRPNDDVGTVLFAVNSDYDTIWGGHVLGYDSFYHDLVMYREAAASKAPFRITCDQTIFNPGRAATVPDRMVVPAIFVGADNAARAIDAGAAAPSTDSGVGDLRLNNGASSTKEIGWRCLTGGASPAYEAIYRRLYGSATYDPPNLATATQQSTTVTVTGAAVGDVVSGVSFSNVLSGTHMWGEVTAANTVTVYHRNDTGGAVDLASGTLRVEVAKQV